MSSSSGKRPPPPQIFQLERFQKQSELVVDSSSSSEDEVEYSKGGGSDDHHRAESLEQVSPLSIHVTITDLVFVVVTALVLVVNATLDFALIPYHYYGNGNAWAAGLTFGIVVVGGVAMLKQFWGVDTYDQVHRIYGHGTCVRLCVNGFPWIAPIITCCTAVWTGYKSRSNPMVLNRYANLLSLTKRFMIVLGLAQCAPQAVLQLVVLLEDGGTAWEGPLLLTSVTTCLTIIMISNLPVKSDNFGDVLKPVAYSGYSRVFIGVRMLSSFASRTLSLACLFSTSRCLLPISPVTSHAIPILLLLLPRLTFTCTEYTRHWLSRKKPTSNVQPRHLRFLDVLVGYVATVFIPVSDPVWMFWYVSVETVVFAGFGVIGEAVTGGECLTFVFGGIIVALFLVTFAIVPCCVPVVVNRTKNARVTRQYSGS